MQTSIKSKVPAIDSTVKILDLLATSAYPLTLSEICEQTELPPATGHRVINSLLAHQFIALDPGRKKAYCIGSGIFQVASTIYKRQSIIPYFYPIAEILKNEIHKTIFLCVPVGNKVVVVSTVESPSSNAFSIYAGQTMSLHQSASGKAILSMSPADFQQRYFKSELKNHPEMGGDMQQNLDSVARAKRLDYAVTDGEVDRSVSCIAAPILNLRNEPVAAISAAINAEHLSSERARAYSKNLVQAARQLSSRII